MASYSSAEEYPHTRPSPSPPPRKPISQNVRHLPGNDQARQEGEAMLNSLQKIAISDQYNNCYSTKGKNMMIHTIIRCVAERLKKKDPPPQNKLWISSSGTIRSSFAYKIGATPVTVSRNVQIDTVA